jgi:sigma-B regulation protein RsbU (phosphoserine phosphatase)
MGRMGLLLRRAWERASSRPMIWLTWVIGLDTVVAVIGAMVGGWYTMTGVLGIGPLLASARCGGRATAAAGVYALALCAIVGAITGTNSETIQRERFTVVFMSSALAVIVAVIRARRENRLITIADKVQRAILRPLPAELGGIAFASHYQSATPGTLVGGDLYDLTMTQFGPRFIIGDVKGKGLDAVGRCAVVIATFRELAFAEPDLVRLAEQVDARLSSLMGIEDFVTAIFAEFGSGEVRLVNCGHQPPVKTGPSVSSGELELIERQPYALPLGLRPKPSRQDVVLKPGDRLLFYTDGLVESRDRSGRFLALDDRVATALAATDLDGCLQRIRGLLLGHTGDRLCDDVLLVACEPLG